jgi:cytochrome oxidase Cu insertion factor (SCO1/SenC/PrrC family)
MNRKPYVFLTVLFFLFIYSSVIAQSIPPFKMLLTNGKTFETKDLPKGKPVAIIYFAPDCDHCQTLMNAVFKQINNFKKVEIVMVTFKPLNEVADFEKNYQTYKYSNIIVGTEVPAFFFRVYYHLVNTPFTVLFDKQGKYIYSYRKETPIGDLVSRVKKLK